MLISNPSGGGEIVSDTDDTRFYDDIGCLAADWGSGRDGAIAYVRLSGGDWADVLAASYAQVDNLRTPMGSGLAAFATPGEARRADRAGRALSWQDVQHMAGEHR